MRVTTLLFALSLSSTALFAQDPEQGEDLSILLPVGLEIECRSELEMRLEVTLSVPEREFKRTRREDRGERRLTRELVLRADKNGRPLALRRSYLKQDLFHRVDSDGPLIQQTGALEGCRVMVSQSPEKKVLVTDLDRLEREDERDPKAEAPPDSENKADGKTGEEPPPRDLDSERLFDPALDFLPAHLVSPGGEWDIPEGAIQELLGEALPKGLKVHGRGRLEGIEELAGKTTTDRQRFATLRLSFQAKGEGCRLEIGGIFKISLSERRPLELRLSGRIDSQEVEAADGHRRILDASLSISVNKSFHRVDKLTEAKDR